MDGLEYSLRLPVATIGNCQHSPFAPEGLLCQLVLRIRALGLQAAAESFCTCACPEMVSSFCLPFLFPSLLLSISLLLPLHHLFAHAISSLEGRQPKSWNCYRAEDIPFSFILFAGSLFSSFPFSASLDSYSLSPYPLPLLLFQRYIPTLTTRMPSGLRPGGFWFCKPCEVSFRTRDAFYQHKDQMRRSGDVRHIHCKHCGVDFKTHKAEFLHIQEVVIFLFSPLPVAGIILTPLAHLPRILTATASPRSTGSSLPWLWKRSLPPSWRSHRSH